MSAAGRLAADFYGSRQFSGRRARREAILLALTEGLSAEQVAEITGMHVGYVRSLTRTAR